MNRCAKNPWPHRVAALALGLMAAATLAPAPANAQAQRLFPHGVQRGQIGFADPPQVLLDGRPERLAPGARVRNEHNMIALSGTLRGRTFLVNYLRDPAGVVREIWILTPEEAASALPGQTPTPSERVSPAYLN